MQEIYSTKIKKNSQEKFLNISDLYLDKPLTAIYVISAYTDTTLIEELIKELKKKGTGNGGVKFKIFLDERQSRFTEGSFSKDFLIKLDNIISKAKTSSGRSLFSKDSGIFLVNRGSLFHSKLIITESLKKIKMFIGSLNFTSKAFTYNEELCLVQESEKKEKKGKKGIPTAIKQAQDYITLLENIYEKTLEKTLSFPKNGTNKNAHLDSTRVYKVSKDLVIPSSTIFDDNSLIEYLMRGTLIHPSKSRSFNLYFDLKLDQDVIGKAIKKDDISSLIEYGSMRKSLSIIKMLAEQGITIKQNNKNISIKKYCIDTPLGFWCPPEKQPDLEKELKKVNEEEKFKNLFLTLAQKREDLTKRFKEVIQKINERIQNLGIDYKWDYSDLEKAVNAWNKWYNEKLEKENDPIWFSRLTSKYTISKVPNFSDDPIACKEFETSFKVSLGNEIDMKRGSSIAKRIYRSNKKFFQDL